VADVKANVQMKASVQKRVIVETYMTKLVYMKRRPFFEISKVGKLSY